MGKEQRISVLERRLLTYVDAICNHGTEPWQLSARSVFSRLRQRGLQAVLFGGALRSLAGAKRRRAYPRDLDVVFDGADAEAVAELFPDLPVRRNRFGGLRVSTPHIDFDLWPIQETYLLKVRGVARPAFEHLPTTTFLNVEGIAVVLWAEQNVQRVFTRNHEFFDAILSRMLELNAEENPYPSLCVIRSLILAHHEGFKLGPRLARYIARHGRTLTVGQMELDQRKHYGHIRISPAFLKNWIEHVSACAETGAAVELPTSKQESLFAPFPM